MKTQHAHEPLMYEAWRAARMRFIEENPATAKALALEAPPPYRGPWDVTAQPGGGWVAGRINFASPGNFDRLPAVGDGQFSTEAEARAAITKVEAP
jgi:hypothetical protein